MFSFLKQLIGAKQTEQPPRRRPKKRRQEARDPTEPIPVPEVVEGNDHTDWDLWQDSVDSQMQSLSPSSQIHASTMPSELDDLDPFARVGKNRDA